MTNYDIDTTRISLKFHVDFQNGIQIRIPHQKTGTCWKFQVHMAKRKATLIKACHGQQLLHFEVFPQKINLKKKIIFWGKFYLFTWIFFLFKIVSKKFVPVLALLSKPKVWTTWSLVLAVMSAILQPCHDWMNGIYNYCCELNNLNL